MPTTYSTGDRSASGVMNFTDVTTGVSTYLPAEVPVVSTTAPVGPNVDDLWYDSTTERVKRWNGTTWAAAALKGLTESVSVVANTGAAKTVVDVTTATIHDYTLSANCTLTFPALAAGKSFLVRLTQGGVGSFLVTWPATVKWPGGVAPTLSTAVGKQDVFNFVCISGTAWTGSVVGMDVR